MADAPKTSANVSRITVDARKYRAASQLADGTIPDREIAQIAGVTQRQLDRWKKDPTFASLVQGLIGEASEAIRHEAVATKAGRIRVLADLHNKILQVIEARSYAQESERQWAPGEHTGLIATKETIGLESISREAAVDVATLKELRSIQEQIAKELGQWDTSVNVRHSGRIDHVHRIPDGLRNLSNDELDALERIALKATSSEHQVAV